MGKARQMLLAMPVCVLIALACLLVPQSAYATDSRSLGTVGLIDYIIQGDFDEEERADAEAAKAWLAGEADKADWYDSYVDLGEEGDATSLANLENALTYMDAVNAIRAENGLNELKVSLFAMAGAELNCSYSGENGALAHAGTYNIPAGMGSYAVENLAQRDGAFSGSSDPDVWWEDYASGNLWGDSWPFVGWYTQEKFMFDSGTQEYSLVGHYLNFVAPELNSFGIAVGDGVTVWKGTNHAGSFTVKEFKKLVADYTSSVFSDVHSSTEHADDVWWMLDTGISTGFEDGTFRGLNSVARQDMAAFLHRLAKYTGTSLPENEITYFPDVDYTDPDCHAEDILWLSSTGITEGFPDNTFRGMSPVARQDMAAFLYRLAGSPEYEPSWAATLKFKDVDESNPHYKEILWLAEMGVSEGWEENDGTCTFRGMQPVARQDMAAFLHRMADKGILG